MKAQKIKDKALQLGYSACGIIPADSFKEYLQCLDKRIETFPESKELYNRFYVDAKPPENWKSIIVCTRRFNEYAAPGNLKELIGKVYLFDSRVSYTNENRAKQEFETFLKMLGLSIQEGYVPARWAAAKAGVGKFGRNNFVYDPEHGSYIWIDAWIVDKVLDYEPKPESMYLSECNDKCHKCIDACPTKALSGEFSMNMGKCITRIQFSPKDVQNNEIRPLLGQWVYGCDVCQDACPVNKDKFTEAEDFPLLMEFEEFLSFESILGMDNDTYLGIVNPRFWYSGEGGLWMWKCNALRGMVNSGDSKYHQTIKQHCGDPDERIREVAVWGCDKLGI